MKSYARIENEYAESINTLLIEILRLTFIVNNKKNCIKLFIALIFFLSFSGYGLEMKEILRNIPREDREDLDSLFYQFVAFDQFGYTLFSDKAISLSGDFTLTPIENILAGLKPLGCFWKKWGVWKKYEKLFKINRFILLSEEDQNDSSCQHVILINKNLFINKVRKNQEFFNKVLGTNVDPEDLLDKMSKGQLSFQDAIKNEQVLWGILLGYGRHNAELFAKRDTLKKTLSKTEGVLKLEKIKDSEENIENLSERLQPLGARHYPPVIFQSICCVADPSHSETKKLKAKYEVMHNKISEIYSQGDLLEISLLKLTSK